MSDNIETKKSFSFKKVLIIILLVIVAFSILTAAINIVNAKSGKTPIFFFAKTINDVDGSVVYNIFPYKITEYRNRANSETYIEVSSSFKEYRNQFYDPKSPKYIFEQSEYTPPVIDVSKHIALIEDVLNKVHSDGFSLKTNQNYSNIYIDTGLKNDNKSKLVTQVNERLAKQYSNKNILFKSLTSLNTENIIKNNKVTDGIYIKVGILETKETEDTMSLELITNVSSLFSQRVVVKNGDKMVFVYSDDFDEKERKVIEEAAEIERQREEAAKKAQEEKANAERLEKERIEKLNKEKQDNFNRGQNRLKELLATGNTVIFNGKTAVIEAMTVETLFTQGKNLSNIKSYNILKINTNRTMYQYQEQIDANKSTNIYVKEKQLSESEFSSFIKSLDSLTGYSGTGAYQNTVVLSISYMGKTKNVLLTDINELLKPYQMNI